MVGSKLIARSRHGDLSAKFTRCMQEPSLGRCAKEELLAGISQQFVTAGRGGRADTNDGVVEILPKKRHQMTAPENPANRPYPPNFSYPFWTSPCGGPARQKPSETK